MLHRRPIKYRIYRPAKWANITAWVLNIGAASIIKLPLRPDAGAAYLEVRAFGENHSWWIVLCSTITLAITSKIMQVTGRPTTWDTLHNLLDGLQNAIFPAASYPVPDEHKATIFKAVKSCKRDKFWKRVSSVARDKKEWLIPVVRSGHLSQETEACFRICDEGAECSGVAGQAWARNSVVSVHDLPDISNGEATVTAYRQYAKQGFVKRDWAELKKPKARAILAMPIMVKGEPWGVLVFDSRLPTKIKYEEVESMFRVVSKHLNNLIAEHL